MLKKRPKVVLLVFGKGGHTAQMNRFINNQPKQSKVYDYVALTNSNKILGQFLAQYYLQEARDKYSVVKNIFVFFTYLLLSSFQMMRIMCKYRVVGMISTGPGMAVVPGLFCRLLGAKIIYFESWSRISTPAIAGKFMYHIAHLFFIQHKSIQKYYPKAIYMGRL
jgi:UDP-N-acetylglucosamine:LPS N-acetylglucosamine transferase